MALIIYLLSCFLLLWYWPPLGMWIWTGWIRHIEIILPESNYQIWYSNYKQNGRQLLQTVNSKVINLIVTWFLKKNQHFFTSAISGILLVNPVLAGLFGVRSDIQPNLIQLASIYFPHLPNSIFVSFLLNLCTLYMI